MSLPNREPFATREQIAESLSFLGRCCPELPPFDHATLDAWVSVLGGMWIPPGDLELACAVERVARRQPIPSVAHLCLEIEVAREIQRENAVALAEEADN